MMKFLGTSVLLLTLVLFQKITSSSCARISTPYSIPTPKFEVFSPQGLRVSIPHVPGMKLFVFMGNVNKPMPIGARGQLSMNVMHPTEDGALWTFEDPNVKLRVGDRIHYWLFVVKDRLGYRLDSDFQVEDVTPSKLDLHSTPDSHHTTPSSLDNTIPLNGSPNNKDAACIGTLLSFVSTIQDTLYQIDELKDSNRILKDLLLKHPETATTLTLDGPYPAHTSPTAWVQEVLRQKLNLPQVKSKNVVKRTNGRIKFEVDSLDDKVAVLRAAKERLKNSRINILY